MDEIKARSIEAAERLVAMGIDPATAAMLGALQVTVEKQGEWLERLAELVERIAARESTRDRGTRLRPVPPKPPPAKNARDGYVPPRKPRS